MRNEPSASGERESLIHFTRRALMGGVSVAPLLLALPGRTLAATPQWHRPGFPIRELIKPDIARSRDWRNLHKPVRDRRVLDDMEGEGGWTATPAVRFAYSTERARTGTRSLRMSVLQRDEAYIRSARQPNGSFSGSAILFEQAPGGAVLTRSFAQPQDWAAYNRISLWCFVHPGNPINTLALEFLSDGARAGPVDPVAINYIGDLVPGKWNHLVWEIPEIQRDRVISFSIFQPRWGVPIAGTSPIVTYDFDLLELQRVEAERVEGWQVSPGQIAYCHTGYASAAEKIAIAPAGSESSFELLHVDGKRAARYPVERVSNRRGDWRRLDFSAFTAPGTWVLACGPNRSEPFRIGPRPLAGVAEATLNAFYGLRCGHPVPGVHDACHRDVFVKYQGETRSLDGGWHDAGNLTQNANNTHLAIYSLLRLADALHQAGEGALGARADEEAGWGLDWSVRMRFAPGLRCNSVPASFYTDNVAGNADDVVIADRAMFGPAVGENVWSNILAILASARAATSWKARDPRLARSLLAAATADFAVTFPKIEPFLNDAPTDMNRGSWADMAGYAALAAAELFRASGAAAHRDAAIQYGNEIVSLQEQRFVDAIAVAGYFYEDRSRKRIVHEFHSSFQEGRIQALELLAELFPDHPDRIYWSTALTLYGESFCATGSEASAPFDIIPAAVWRRSDVEQGGPPDRAGAMFASRPNAIFPTVPSPQLVREQMLRQFEDAADLGADHRLRVFPLWFDHVRHGGTVIHMAQTSGLAAVARHRRSRRLMNLVDRQLQWVLGANPFSRSLIYGVGKDWWQNFTVEIPNLVGGACLGINSYSKDSPAWGNNAVFPYKEIWIMASCRLALVLADIFDGVAEARPADLIAVDTGAAGAVSIRADRGLGSRRLTLSYHNLDGPSETEAGALSAGLALSLQEAGRPWAILAREIDGGADQFAFGLPHGLRSMA